MVIRIDLKNNRVVFRDGVPSEEELELLRSEVEKKNNETSEETES